MSDSSTAVPIAGTSTAGAGTVDESTVGESTVGENTVADGRRADMDSAADARRQRFHDDVAAMNIKGGKTGSGGATQPLGLAAMVIGTIGAFALYGVSLGQDDLRNISSFQIMAIGFLALTVLGAAFYIAGSLSKLLRLWLLRQLMEQQGHVDQISDALRGRTSV